MTSVVAGLIANEGVLLTANDATFGDQWAGQVQTCSVVYQHGSGPPMLKTCLENQPLRILPRSNYAVELADAAWLDGPRNTFAYSPSTTDLTIEAWVQTTTGGPLVSFTATGRGLLSNDTYETLAFGATPAGVLCFSITNVDLGSPDITSATTAPTAVCDGEWHHIAAVRAGTALSILVDGVAQLVATHPAALGHAVIIGDRALLGVGGQQYQVTPQVNFGPSYLTGSIDELRLWTIARPSGAIAAGMHHRVPDDTSGLVGAWTFDDADLTDSSQSAAVLTAVESITFGAGVDIEPAGSSYLVAQAQPAR